MSVSLRRQPRNQFEVDYDRVLVQRRYAQVPLGLYETVKGLDRSAILLYIYVMEQQLGTLDEKQPAVLIRTKELTEIAGGSAFGAQVAMKECADKGVLTLTKVDRGAYQLGLDFGNYGSIDPKGRRRRYHRRHKPELEEPEPETPEAEAPQVEQKAKPYIMVTLPGEKPKPLAEVCPNAQTCPLVQGKTGSQPRDGVQLQLHNSPPNTGSKTGSEVQLQLHNSPQTVDSTRGIVPNSDTPKPPDSRPDLQVFSEALLRAVNKRMSGFPPKGLFAGIHAQLRRKHVPWSEFIKAVTVRVERARSPKDFARWPVMDKFVTEFLKSIALKRKLEARDAKQTHRTRDAQAREHDAQLARGQAAYEALSRSKREERVREAKECFGAGRELKELMGLLYFQMGDE